MGKKSKLLHPGVRETILDHIRRGNYVKTACLAAGICEDTYYNWQKAAEVGGGNGNEIYVELFEELKKARSENIARNVDIIQTAGPKNWTAAAWLLERMNPAEYGKRLELEVGPSKVLIALQERAQAALGTVKVLDAGISGVIEEEDV